MTDFLQFLSEIYENSSYFRGEISFSFKDENKFSSFPLSLSEKL